MLILNQIPEEHEQFPTGNDTIIIYYWLLLLVVWCYTNKIESNLTELLNIVCEENSSFTFKKWNIDSYDSNESSTILEMKSKLKEF